MKILTESQDYIGKLKQELQNWKKQLQVAITKNCKDIQNKYLTN